MSRFIQYLTAVAIIALLSISGQQLSAQDSTAVVVSDSVALKVADSTMTAAKSTEQLLLEMQQQLTQMQMKLDQIQNTIPAPKDPNREIIPAKAKSTSHFYWSIQFGFFVNSSEYTELETPEAKQSLGTHFSYAIKPSFGYNFTDRISVGCKLVFADCQFSGLQNASSLRYILANALIGGGISLSDYMTWNVSPYFRYRITKLFWERVNLWAELSVYAGQSIPRDSKTHALQAGESSVIYGIGLRPMITCNLNKNLAFFTIMDFLSWNGSYKMSNGTAVQNNSFNFQVIPIYSIITGLFNLGIIKRF